MPEGYDLHDGRFVQEQARVSIADALVVASGVVPEGKVWTILGGTYYPSVNENQYIFWSIYTRTTGTFVVTRTQQIACSAVCPQGLVTEGMELKLFPGDAICANRAAATAGSQMTMFIRFIETDLPPYDYIEPQERKRITAFKHSVARAASGGRVAGSSITRPPAPPGGGRAGGREPY